MPDYSNEITELETLINAGVTKVKINGEETTFDLEAAQRRLRYLKENTDNAVPGKAKYGTASMKMPGF